MDNLGKTVEEFIEFAGMQKSVVARDLGMSRQQLNNIIAGRGNFKIDQFTKFCKLYNVNANRLLTGHGSYFSINNDLSEAFYPNASIEIKNLGSRIKEIQTQNKLLDYQMAKKLEISENDYIKLCLNKIPITQKIIVNLKQNFKNIDMNWLFFGYEEKIANQNITLPALTSEQYKKLIDLLNER